MSIERTKRYLLLILLLALLVRLPLLPARGWERDLYWFQTWAESAREQGVTRVAEHTWCDYPPGYLYVLKGVAALRGQFPPAEGEDDVLFRILLKLPATLADLVTAWLLFRLLRQTAGDRVALWGAGIVALNPLVIYESAYWGQVDSVSTLLMLAATMLALADRLRLSAAFAAVAVLTKLQMAIFLPILMILAYRRGGRRALLGSIGAGLAAALGLCLPYFASGRIDHVTQVFTDAVGRYPFVSMNAHNLWWIVSGASGTEMPDLATPYPGLTYRSTGLLLFAAFYGLVLIEFWRHGKAGDNRTVFLSLAAVAFGFYMLPTQMHERYVFPAIIFLVPIAIRSRLVLLGYAALTFVSFLTLVTTLTLAWPENHGLLVPSLASIRVPLTLALAWLNLVALAGVTLFLAWRGGARSVHLLAGVVLVVFALPALATRGPVWVSDCEPLAASQGWGQLGRDRSVERRTLSIAGFRYGKGVGTHAPSSLRYHLGGNYRRFEADIGIQYGANLGSNAASFEVWTATRGGEPQRIYSSGVFRGLHEPLHLILDVSGAETLWLVTGDGGDGMTRDHTNWANARLVP